MLGALYRPSMVLRIVTLHMRYQGVVITQAYCTMDDMSHTYKCRCSYYNKYIQ